MVHENPSLPDPRQRPTISVAEAAALLGIGKSLAYEGVAHGEIPSIRIGRTIRVPTARLLDVLGLLEVGR